MSASSRIKSGLWLITLPRESRHELGSKLLDPIGIGPPSLVAAEAAEYLSAALALDEGGLGTLFVRRDNPSHGVISDILQELNV